MRRIVAAAPATAAASTATPPIRPLREDGARTLRTFAVIFWRIVCFGLRRRCNPGRGIVLVIDMRTQPARWAGSRPAWRRRSNRILLRRGSPPFRELPRGERCGRVGEAELEGVRQPGIELVADVACGRAWRLELGAR